MAARYIKYMRCMPLFKPLLDCNIHKNMRTCTSCNSREKNAQNVNTYKSLLTTHTGIIDSSVRFLCQETTLSSLGNTTMEEQNSKTKVPAAFNASSKYSKINNFSHPTGVKLEVKQDSEYLDPLEEDDSFEEKGDVPEKQKRLIQQPFNEILRMCKSPCDILDLTMKYSLTYKQNSNCLATIWYVFKKMSEEQKWLERRMMFEHPAFPELCYQVMQAARQMTCEDLVYSLHALVKLRVSQRTRLLQTLVRVCQERLNEFDERTISVLANCMEDLDGSKNVDALRAGLQLLVELQIPKIKSVLSLQKMMRCIGKDAPISLKKKLEYKAMSIMDQFSRPNCEHMFTTLAKIHFLSLPILSNCSNRIIQNVIGIPFWQLIHILQSCRDLQYRNEVLFSTIADYVTSTMYMWQTKQVLLFLSVFENLGFRPVVLLDTFAEQAMQNPESLNLKDIIITLRVYSLLNHLPKGQHQWFLDPLNRVLETNLPKIPAVELLRAIYSCCLLGYFPQVPFNVLLQDSILNELMASEFQMYMDKDRRKVFPIDEVEAPANQFDGQRVAVLCCPVSSFCLGTMHPRGKLAMKIRHLKVLGYHVVLVHEQAFEKLKEEDQVEFLRRKVFSEDTASDHNLQNHHEIEV
uniref:FAST kinase domain-containing protein 2, mitochondrial isoform X2 n=1 Tax=Geotrypetes seraphini TaxID=260995 RepID=A0A6P8QVE0_GEOSA|nr:FAST kinase domain-containing protein 2, mitochondrial isoform X2 [Geotrypetes seraphini]